MTYGSFRTVRRVPIGTIDVKEHKTPDELLWEKLVTAKKTLEAAGMPITRMNLVDQSKQSVKSIDTFLRKNPAKKHLLKIVTIPPHGRFAKK